MSTGPTSATLPSTTRPKIPFSALSHPSAVLPPASDTPHLRSPSGTDPEFRGGTPEQSKHWDTCGTSSRLPAPGWCPPGPSGGRSLTYGDPCFARVYLWSLFPSRVGSRLVRLPDVGGRSGSGRRSCLSGFTWGPGFGVQTPDVPSCRGPISVSCVPMSPVGHQLSSSRCSVRVGSVVLFFSLPSGTGDGTPVSTLLSLVRLFRCPWVHAQSSAIPRVPDARVGPECGRCRSPDVVSVPPCLCACPLSSRPDVRGSGRDSVSALVRFHVVPTSGLWTTRPQSCNSHTHTPYPDRPGEGCSTSFGVPALLPSVLPVPRTSGRLSGLLSGRVWVPSSLGHPTGSVVPLSVTFRVPALFLESSLNFLLLYFRDFK